MGAGKIPSGPSEAQIKRESDFERERVKFEGEKRQYLEKVAAYDLIAQGTRQAQMGTFENQTQTPLFDSSGLFIPMKFNPSLTYQTMGPTGTSWTTGSGQNLGNERLDWYWSPNLGLRNPYDQR